jgi:hypothetical protein
MEIHGTDATIGVAIRSGLAFQNYVPISHWSHSRYSRLVITPGCGAGGLSIIRYQLSILFERRLLCLETLH